jgi:cysteine-rich repeat protein
VLDGVARRCLLLVTGLALLAPGCGQDLTEANDTDTGTAESETGSSCVVGTLDCACTPGGGCDPGLECMADVCAEQSDEGGTGECVDVDCPCDGDTDCDEGLLCVDGSCEADDCGNATVDPGEICDDGNAIEGDGCDNDCTRTEVLKISLGGVHSCALIEGGRIRCWGHNGGGQTGYGSTEDIGDNEHPKAAGDLPLPAAVDVEAGGAHTCALFEDGDVRCWGFNTSGQLGLGNSGEVVAIGDDESLEGLQPVNLVATVNEVGVGVVQSCARAAGQLRCWGAGLYGQLGTASTSNVGDDELPLDVSAVMLGGEPVHLAIGGSHGCAILATGGVRCWGRNDSGQLGLGNTAHVGDNEYPLDVPELDMIPPSLPADTTVVDLGIGLVHSCALLSTGDVLCWGAALSGQLGQGNSDAWGNQPGETPAALTPIQLGAPASAIAAGYQHTCALLEGGDVRCWGNAESGQLGNGDEEFVGLVNVPADRDPVALGGVAIGIASGGVHSCAILDDYGVICWGHNEYGQLGYGFTHTIGDDELPEVAGRIELL